MYKYRCNSGLEMDGPDTVSFDSIRVNVVWIFESVVLESLKLIFIQWFVQFEFEFQVFCEGENWNSSVPTCLVKPGDPLLELPELVTLVLTND